MIAKSPHYPRVPEELSALLAPLGVELLGVADTPSAAQAEREYREWIRLGYHGEMRYLSVHEPLKYHPEQLLDGCRSILVVGLNYFQEAPWRSAGRRTERGETESTARTAGGRTREGRVARYAWGRDYHRLLGKRLRHAVRLLENQYPGDRFRSFTDATPLAERFYAERAGISFTGRNTLSISSRFGSWFLIGEILSTREFDPSGPPGGKQGACPSGCTRCIDVCPTGALISSHRIDASKCISYLTIENRGPIPQELRDRLGDWVFGCDLCQEVCPLNIRAEVTGEADLTAHRAGPLLDLREILTIDSDDQFRDRFAGSPVMRAGRRGLLRNACVAAGNSGNVDLLPVLKALAAGEDSLIAEHAAWAVEKLQSFPGVGDG